MKKTSSTSLNENSLILTWMIWKGSAANHQDGYMDELVRLSGVGNTKTMRETSMNLRRNQALTPALMGNPFPVEAKPTLLP